MTADYLLHGFQRAVNLGNMGTFPWLNYQNTHLLFLPRIRMATELEAGFCPKARECRTKIGLRPMDNRQDFFLFLRRNPDALQRLPDTTIRADFRFVIGSGKCRMSGVGISANWANLFLHLTAPPFGWHPSHPANIANQNRSHGIPYRKFGDMRYSAILTFVPRA